MKFLLQNYLKLVFIAACLLGSAVPSFAQFKDHSETLGFQGGGKAAFCDFDGDGFVDLYAGQLWQNQKGEGFKAIDGVAGGEGIWGDFDNDGMPDLFVYTGEGALYRNAGKGKFEKVDFPRLPTVNSRGAVWFDLNNDGLLDLFVGGYEIWQKSVHPDVVYVNRGKSVFEEVWRSPENFSARGVAAADFNEDGFTDIYVSNYRLQPNFLLRNNQRSGFDEIGKTSGTMGIPDAVINYTGGIRYPICGHTIGSSFGDLDNDGHLDLFVGNFSHPRAGQDHPQFLKNGGPSKGFVFEDKSGVAKLAWQESYASPTLGDFDNDGNLDLFLTTVYAVGSGNIRNYPVLYRSLGDWKFIDETEKQQLQKLGPTYQAAWADIDNDGDLDLCTAGKLFINELKSTNSWIRIKLEGDGKKVNRSAIGSIARIKIGNHVITRQVESGTGEGNQNDLVLHFGLGEIKEAKVDLEVTWPGNRKSVFNGLEVNKTHLLRSKD